MTARAADVKSLFGKALELATPAERAAFLDEACAADPTLRSEVEGLLQALGKAGNFLNPASSLPGTAAWPPLVERPGAVIGPYKLLQEIGEGGMGTVFLAEQTEPVRRKVALKIIKAGLDSTQVIARFEAERQALAMMDHPNIAKVLDAGQTPPANTGGSTRPYFVMELVKGVSITTYCDENRLTPRQRLELFIPVCQAIQHAHQKGIIHRDIKPSNVLVALYDGKPVPKVIDFGIAKATDQQLTEKTLFTKHGQIVGTFEYMSPEQATLNQLDIDSRSDIYSLGVLLYELLTGCTPLDKERLRTLALDQMLRTIREEEPMRPSVRLSSGSGALAMAAAYRGSDSHKLAGLMRGELDWIAMKALDKDRGRRYDTASALAADVRRYLSEEPVEARAPSAAYRLRKFVRRNRGPVVAAAVVLLALLVGVIGTTWAMVRAVQSEREAQTERETANEASDEALRLAKDEKAARKKAEASETKAEWRLYASHIASAQREWETHNTALFYHYLEQCRPDFRGWEHDFLYTLANQNQRTLRGHTDGRRLGEGWGRSVAFSPDGKRLAASGARDNTVVLWDAASGQKILNLKGYTPQLPHNPVGDWIFALAFSPDGKRLAIASNDKTVRVWDAASGAEILTFKGHTGGVTSVAFSPDGKRLASTSVSGFKDTKGGARATGVKVWDAASGAELLTLTSKGFKLLSPVRNVAFSPDGKYLAGASEDGTVTLWDVVSGQEVRSLKGPRGSGWYACVAFSPDGKRLASAANDKTVKVWDTASGQEIATLKGHTDAVNSVAFSPDGKRLASAAKDKTVKLWDVASGEEILTLKGHTDYVTSVAFSPDSERLASASLDNTVKLWDVTGPQGVVTLKGTLMAFSPDGKHLAKSGPVPSRRTPDADGSLKLFDVASGKEVLTFKQTPQDGKRGNVECMAFSPDGKRLAGATSAGFGRREGFFIVTVWDTVSGQEILTFKRQTGDVHSLAFSPDGKRLATATQNWGGGESGQEFVGDTQKLWDAATGQEVLTLKGETGPISSVAFSPDGTRLASASAWPTDTFAEPPPPPGEVKLWDAASGKVLLTLKGHTDRVNCVAFSLDSKRLASASDDKTVRIWDSATGAEVLTLKGHIGHVTSVAFSPDGTRLASASMDNTVKVWDAASGLEVLTLRGHTGVDRFGVVVGVHSVAFSPDGKRLASASGNRGDGEIKIWDATKSIKELDQK